MSVEQSQERAQRRVRSVRKIAGSGLAAMLIAGGIGFASPALADDGAADGLTPIIAAAYQGAPEGVSGELITIDVTISSDVLGSPAPTGMVMLFDTNGEPGSIALLEEEDAGVATLQFRPLRHGEHFFEVGYSGDDTYAQHAVEMPLFDVHPAPTALSVSFAEDASVDDLIAYGGGFVDITATVGSFLGSNSGQPSGEITIYVNDVAVESFDVDGSPMRDDADYFDRHEDLDNPDAWLEANALVLAPHVMLGTEAFDLRVEFVSSNWFADATWEGSISLLPVTTTTTLFVGDVFEPVTKIDSKTTVFAFVDPVETFEHPTGTVQFYLNGEAYGDQVEVVEGAAWIDWTPTAHDDFVFGAEYVADSPNFLHSVTTEPYWVSATLPVTPTEPVAPAKPAQPQELAQTGGESVLPLTAVLLLAAGSALLILRRRVA